MKPAPEVSKLIYPTEGTEIPQRCVSVDTHINESNHCVPDKENKTHDDDAHVPDKDKNTKTNTIDDDIEMHIRMLKKQHRIQVRRNNREKKALRERVDVYCAKQDLLRKIRPVMFLSKRQRDVIFKKYIEMIVSD